MATLTSKRLQEALKKAKNVGRAEESVVIDGCSVVLQSLPGASYDEVLQETSELDGSRYYHAFQIGFLCRSVVEFEGIDLREVTLIEDEVPAGDFLLQASVTSEAKALKAAEALKELGILLTVAPPDGGTKTVLLERHEWLRRQILTWSQEAVAVAYRKYADVVVAGEEKAKAGVQFKVPDESVEDKFRRLLSEAKELEGEVPPELAKRILDEAGYLPKSTPEELAEIAMRAKEFAESQKVAIRESLDEREPEPEPAVEVVPTISIEDLMKRRVPLNRIPINAPAPPREDAPVLVPPPSQLKSFSTESSRAAQIAALEADVDPGLGAAIDSYPRPVEVAELLRKSPEIDFKGINSILEQPPVVGINPRFRKPVG